MKNPKRPAELSQSSKIKWIPGYEGFYAVTDCGRVCSYLWKKPRLLRSSKATARYPRVNLTLNGSVATRRIHTLVLAAFVGERPDGQCARHMNGNPSDNRLSNLKYGTYEENQRDRVQHGTSNRGESNGLSKLSEDDVREIRRIYPSSGKALHEVAEMFGVSGDTVYSIQTRRTWGWLD